MRSDRVMTDVANALGELGVPSAGFHSRQATTSILREATLILTADARQNAWIVEETPGLFRRTYLIRQAARLLSDLPGGADPVAFLERVKDRPRPDDDIDDPYRKGPEAARRAVREIDEALAIILPAIGATGSAHSG